MKLKLLEQIMKWSTILLLSLILFLVLKENRESGVIGGEILILFFPLIWYLCEKTIHDLVHALKEID